MYKADKVTWKWKPETYAFVIATGRRGSNTQTECIPFLCLQIINASMGLNGESGHSDSIISSHYILHRNNSAPTVVLIFLH